MVIGGAPDLRARDAAGHPPGAHRGAPAPEGDTHYPDFDRPQWRETDREAHDGIRASSGWSGSRPPGHEPIAWRHDVRHSSSPAPFGRVLDRDGHRLPPTTAPSTSRAPPGSPSTSPTTATTASWSPARRGSRRPPATEEDGRLLRAVVEAVGDRAERRRRRRHQRHRALRRAGRAGREARRATALLLVTPYYSKPTAGRRARALRGGRRRHRPAGDALRHPRPHRHRDR